MGKYTVEDVNKMLDDYNNMKPSKKKDVAVVSGKTPKITQEIPVLKNNAVTLPTMGELSAQSKLYAPKTEIPVLKSQSTANNGIANNISAFQNIASGNVKPKVSNEFEARIATGVNAANPEKYIAGQKEVTTGDSRTWFTKGALEDGYQKGDVSKTVLGTYKDAEENATAGILGMGEKILDGLVSLLPAAIEGYKAQNSGIAYNFDINEYSKQQALAQEFIEKDLYDEEALSKKVSPYVGIPGLSVVADNVIGDKTDENSVLGEKSDALVQSAGQLAATAGLQAVGVPWWATSGATSMGGEVESALKRGATMDEATISGLVTAGAEILTEKISGGIKFGGKTLDDKMTKAIADKISNKVVNAMAQTGVGALGEGGEEVLSGYMSAIGQKLTYMNDKEITEIFSSDEALESFIGGAILGGGATAVNEFSKLPTNKPLNLPENDTVSAQTEVSASDVANAEEKAQKEAVRNNLANAKVEVDNKKASGQKITDTVEKALLDPEYEKTHSAEELQVMNDYLNAVDPRIVSLVEDNRINGYNDASRAELGVTDADVASEMKRLTGIDSTGYPLVFEGKAIRHIDKDHGKNGGSDNSMTDADSIARALYVLNNYDSVELGKGTGMYKDSTGHKSKTVLFSKKVDGTYYVVEALPDTTKKENYIVSTYAKNKKEGKQLPDVQAPGGTSTTSTAIPSNNSIPNPEQTVNNPEMKVRGYNESIVEKTDLPEEVKNEFITNPQMYEVLKNKTTQEQAQTIIDNSTTEEAFSRFHSLLDKKEPVSVPLGYYLSQKLIAEGRTDTAVEVLRSMSEKLTEAGQFTQAAAITLMQGDPVTALKYITRELDNLNAKGREQFKGKWKDFELTTEEKAAFSKLQPGDTEGIKAVYQSVFNRIQKEYPSTMKEKLLEYRRVAMLLNSRTNVRNVVSNALLMPVRWTTDRVSALGQNAIKLVNPDFQTTQAVVVDKKSKQLASEAWETVKDSILETGNKYDDAKQAIRNKQVFKGTVFSQFIDNVTGGAITKVNALMGKDVTPSLVETARNLTYWLLGKGDDVFVKKNFESRMASYIAAQKITDLESIPADAYTLATQEALKATFKDDTALAKVLSNAKKNLGVVGEVVLPFTKTPANLAMRGIDYSPAGLIRDVVNLARKENRTHADVTQAMDNMSKGVVGTAAIALGYILAKAGFISGALSDDKDEAAFQQKMGMLPYAIRIGDNYYTYNWAQPAAIPIILGATIYQSSVESDSAINAWTQGALAASNAWLELSPLQNLQNIFGGYGTPMENLAGELADMPSSFIPAQLGAISRVTDTTQRQTYSNGDFWGSRVNSAVAKIPVLNETLPASYDTWGNEIKRSNSVGEAAFAQLINPGQLGNANVTPIDDEIMRLYSETGDNAVFPKKAAWSYTFGGESHKLDNVTYSEMQKKMGQTSYEMATDFINSDVYGTLDDNQKATILSNLYGFAEALAKSELLGYDIASNSTYKKYYKIYNDLGLESVVNYQIYKMEIDKDGNGSVSGAEAEEYLRNEPIPRLEKSYWFETFMPNNKNNPFK